MIRIISSRHPSSSIFLSGKFKEGLAVFHNLAVLDADLHDLALFLGGDLIHQLHGLDNAHHIAFFYLSSPCVT